MLIEINPGAGQGNVRMVTPILIESSRAPDVTNTVISYFPEAGYVGANYLVLDKHTVNLPYAAVRHAFEQAARLNASVVDLTEKNLENVRKSYERSLRKVSRPVSASPAKPLL